MSRKKWLVRYVLLPLAAAVVIVLLLPGNRARLVGFFHGEPFFEGTPATTWGQELNADGPPEKPAFEHLKKAGKAALPVVLELSLRKNSPGQEQARALLIQLGEPAVPGLVKTLGRPATEDRTVVIGLLGDMGGKAQSAVEPLAALLEDPNEDVRQAAMTALEKIGPQAAAATPDLIVILKGKGEARDPAWLARAAKVIGRIGPPARAAVPLLTTCLQHPDARVADEAFGALGRMDKEALAAVPTLIAMVQNRQSPLRARAAATLGKLGPAARLAVPTLIDGLQETDNAALRDSCREALKNMGSAAQPAVPALLTTFGRAASINDIGPTAIPELIQLLGDNRAATRSDAQYFLATFHKNATPALLDTLENDDNPALRRAVAELLGPELGEARDVLPALCEALHDEDEMVRQAARGGIVRFGKTAQPYLERQLRGKDESLRLEAAQLFLKMGGEAKASAPLLLALLKDVMATDPVLRMTVVQALAKMDYHPREALPILIDDLKLVALKPGEASLTALLLVAGHGRFARDADVVIVPILLKNPDWQMRRQAALALGKIGVTKETALPALKQALEDKDKMVQATAAEVLGGAGYGSQELATLLVPLLKDPSPQVQGAALVALAKLGKEARLTVARLHEYARATNDRAVPAAGPDLRDNCIATLGAIGPPAQETAPLLISWLSAPQAPALRQQIIRTLGRLEARDAVKVLEPLMRQDKGAEGVAAALALWRIDKAASALAFLQDGLKDKASRPLFITAIGQVGPPGEAAVPTLIEILTRDPDFDHRALAAEALGRIGINARPAIGALVRALAVPHNEVRRQAALALGQYEEQAAAAVPGLLSLVEDEQSPQVREAAIDALWLIDPDAADNAKIAEHGASRS